MTTRRRRVDSDSADSTQTQNRDIIISIPFLGAISNTSQLPTIVNSFLPAKNSYSHKKTDELLPGQLKDFSSSEQELSPSSDEDMERKASYASLANESALRNRSREFKTIVQTIRQKNFYQNVRKNPQPIQQHSHFMVSARQILLEDIQNAYVTLERLSKLVRKKSLFDNKSSEVDSLSAQLKSEIAAIKRKITDLNALKGLNPGRKDQVPRSAIISLESCLRNMSTEFEDVLKKRIENMKFQSDRRKELGDTRGSPRYPQRGFPQGSVLVADEKAALVKSASTSSFSSVSSDHVAIDMDAALSSRYDQTQMMAEADQSEEYLSTRLEEIRNIERTIVEMGQITQQMIGLIHEQGETMQRIEAHVEETAGNIEAGNQELLRYFRSVSSNRWLLFKCFFVVVIFIILFVVFL
ncbi:syntaxin-5-like [Artemia franciscana]|uniref:syntaxin-5-like n=1 Tax=Artemia franciscana TaxID=6661 RepID=UPI0032D9D505